MFTRPFSLLSILLIVFVNSWGVVWAKVPFDYFANSWSVIGLRDYRDATRITPDNQLVLSDGEVQIRIGTQQKPLSRLQTKRLLKGWLPIVLLDASDGEVRYGFKVWATPLPTVREWKNAFNWPIDGDNYLNWVWINVVNGGAEPAEASITVIAESRPEEATQSVTWTLEPAGTAETVLQFAFHPVSDHTLFATADPQTWLSRTVSYWEGLLNDAAKIEVPCRKSTQALKAAHVCQLIVSDHGEPHCGEGFYDRFYIRDGGYQLMELEEAGFFDAAERAIAFDLRSQREDGRFETQEGQLDANGQALWTLWQYYLMSRDHSWLEEAYPQMCRAVDWILEARQMNPVGSPFVGVLPAAPADGEYLWDGNHHIVGYDLWNLRGILCTAAAARELGRTEEEKKLLNEIGSYRRAIDQVWKNTGCSHFPPSWEKEGTHWGNTEIIWPTPVIPRTDPRIVATIQHARKVHGGGFVEGTMQWLGKQGAIHPYLSFYTTMASLRVQQHEQVVEDFYWYLLHSTATHAFPEGIFWERRFAWEDTIPHATGASNYAILLRHMLVDEDQGLQLLRAVPDWWLAQGKEVRVIEAPTHYGEVSLRVTGRSQGVEVEWEPPRRNPPRKITLYLPESRPLLNAITGVEVVYRQNQKVRWDFETLAKKVPSFASSNLHISP